MKRFEWYPITDRNLAQSKTLDKESDGKLRYLWVNKETNKTRAVTTLSLTPSSLEKYTHFMVVKGVGWKRNVTGNNPSGLDDNDSVDVIISRGLNQKPRRTVNWSWSLRDNIPILYYRKSDEQPITGKERLIESMDATEPYTPSTYEYKGEIKKTDGSSIKFGFKLANQLGSCGTCTLYSVGVENVSNLGNFGIKRNLKSTTEDTKKALEAAARAVITRMRRNNYNALVVVDGNGSFFSGQLRQASGYSARGLIKKVAELGPKGGKLMEGIHTKNKNSGNKLGVWSYTLDSIDTSIDW